MESYKNTASLHTPSQMVCFAVSKKNSLTSGKNKFSHFWQKKRGYLSLCRFFTAAVWCVPALRVPLVHSLINHFRQKMILPCLTYCTARAIWGTRCVAPRSFTQPHRKPLKHRRLSTGFFPVMAL